MLGLEFADRTLDVSDTNILDADTLPTCPEIDADFNVPFAVTTLLE